MFVMKMPPEVVELVKQLEVTYPRAANNIRTFWGSEDDCRQMIANMLSHTSGTTPEGFSTEAIRLVMAIQEKYEQQCQEFRAINKSKDEIAKAEESKKNVWSKPWFKQ